MTTPDWVFSRAIHLMDEQNESSGATSTQDTQEYRLRTLSILNVLRHELFPYSDTFQTGEDGKRAICPELKDFSDEIGLDDVIAQGIMPYGLAAHLLMDENPSAAAFFQSRYEELRNRLAVGIPAQSEDITDLYGGIEYGEFSRW